MTTPAQHMIQALSALPPAVAADKLAIFVDMLAPAPETAPTPATLVIDMLNNALAATLVLNALADQYEVGPPDTGAYEIGPPEFPTSPGPGLFEVGPSEIVIPWGFGISIMDEVNPDGIAGVGAATLVLDGMEDFFAVETFPPQATLVISMLERGDNATISIDMIAGAYFVNDDLNDRGLFEVGAPEATFDGIRLEPDPAYWFDNIVVNSPDDTRLDLLVLDEAELP